MSRTFYITEGDLLPSFELQLRGENEQGVEVVQALNGTEAVEMVFYDSDGNELWVDDMVIVDGPTGRVKRDWQEGETDTVGKFSARVRVTFPGATPGPLSFPNRYKIPVIVVEA